MTKAQYNRQAIQGKKPKSRTQRDDPVSWETEAELENKSAVILSPQDVHITEAWVNDSLNETSPVHEQLFIKLWRNND